MVIDTDVLIDYLRDVPQAVRFLERQEEALAISVVTVSELYAGVRGENEAAVLETLLSGLHLFEVDRAIAEEAGRLRRIYSRGHNIELPDALIAATSIVHRNRLVTLNRRHFPMLRDLIIPYRK